MKTCSKCKQKLPISNFRKKGWRNNKQRYRSECKKCYSKYEKSPKFLENRRRWCHTPFGNYRIKAQSLIRQKVKSGEVLKTSCIVCGKTKVEAHHPDYNKPESVLWLCRKHHIEKHYPINQHN